MSARVLIMTLLIRYGGGLVKTLMLMTELKQKNIERILAGYVSDGEVRAHPFPGRQKFYVPTAKAARMRNLEPRKYERAPGPQAMVERLAQMMFSHQTGFRVIPDEEIVRDLPRLAAVPGMSHSRYYADTTGEARKLCVLVFDYGREVRKLVRRCRGEVQQRKAHRAFQPLIFKNLFSVTVVTAFERKGERVRELLAKESFPHDVVVVPGIKSLLLPGE